MPHTSIVFIRANSRVMMRASFLVFCSFLIFAGSCKKDRDKLLVREVAMNINGSAWMSTNVTYHRSYDIFRFDAIGSEKNGISRKETFALGYLERDLLPHRFTVPKYISQFQIGVGFFFSNGLEADGGCDSYVILEADSANNKYQITREAGNFSEVWGTFSGTFIRDDSCSESIRKVDTLYITNGTFHLTM